MHRRGYCFNFSFHNQLKTVHLNGKVNRRVDFLVHHLLEYEKDAFFRYKSARQLPPAMNRREKEEQGRHQRGLKIPPKMVQVMFVCCSEPSRYMAITFSKHMRDSGKWRACLVAFLVGTW